MIILIFWYIVDLIVEIAMNQELTPSTIGLYGGWVCHEKRTKNPAEMTGNRYKIEIMMGRTQKLKGLSAASLRLKTLNDNS